MKLLWRRFFRIVLGAALLVVLFAVFLGVGFTRALVSQSEGWPPIADAPRDETLSGSLPSSATKFCFAGSSVGLGGRFMAYAVDGDLPELHRFAQTEFGAHWDKPAYQVTHNRPSPFDLDYIASLENAYSVDLDWLQDSILGTGSVYRDSKGQGSHMPTIFVDEINSMCFVSPDLAQEPGLTKQQSPHW